MNILDLIDNVKQRGKKRALCVCKDEVPVSKMFKCLDCPCEEINPEHVNLSIIISFKYVFIFRIICAVIAYILSIKTVRRKYLMVLITITN